MVYVNIPTTNLVHVFLTLSSLLHPSVLFFILVLCIFLSMILPMLLCYELVQDRGHVCDVISQSFVRAHAHVSTSMCLRNCVHALAAAATINTFLHAHYYVDITIIQLQ